LETRSCKGKATSFRSEMREFKWLRCRMSCGRNCSAEYDFEFG
jgi:hypothetical protein